MKKKKSFTEFEVKGPFEIKCYMKGNMQFLGRDESAAFFKNPPVKDFADMVGCYVFGKQRNDGRILPYYVGLTCKSFSAEVFTDRNIVTYNEVIFKYVSGKPVMFFVVPPKKPGPVGKARIEELETFLIPIACDANRDCQNKNKTSGRISNVQWCINGVWKSKRPGISNAERDFVQMMKGISNR